MHYPGIQAGTGFKEAGQLFAKKMFGEVCGKRKQFYLRAEKQAARNVPGSLFYKLCRFKAQFHAGMQDAASRVVRQLLAVGWRRRSGKLP